MKTQKFLNVFITSILIAMAVGIPANVFAQSPDPRIEVRLNQNVVAGTEWPLDASVTLTIDDPSNGSGIDYMTTQIAVPYWQSGLGRVSFELGSLIKLQPDFIVSLSDDTVTKEHTVRNVRITGFDYNADTISGTGDPYGVIKVFIHDLVQRTVTADSDGKWIADFGNPGAQEGEEVTFDISPIVEGEAMHWDDPANGDNDQTQITFTTNFVVSIGNDDIWGNDWFVGEPVNLTIDDPTTPESPDYSETAMPEVGPWVLTGVGFQLRETFDIKPGHIVTLSQSEITKEQVVTDSIVIKQVDYAGDTVSGMATPGAFVDVFVGSGGPNAGWRTVIADPEGNWMADYSQPGSRPWEEILDITPEMGINAAENDVDGDSTTTDWQVTYPDLQVYLDKYRIEARSWPNGSLVTLTIDDPDTLQIPDYTSSGISGPASWNPSMTTVEFDLTDIYQYEIGDIITASDGTFTKTHTVVPISVTMIDADDDVIAGTTDPNTDVIIVINGGQSRITTSDDGGDWFVDFSFPWEEQEAYDLAPGLGGDARCPDEDGDVSRVDWSIPNPSFSARLVENQVHGYGWPLGDNVTLFVDGNEIGTKTVEVPDWDPNQTFVWFDLGESLTLQAGQLINMTNGNITKTHTVTNLIVANVDPATDIVFGEAAPQSQVDIGHIYCDENGCYGFRRETADLDGVWAADFSIVGEDDDEQDIVDIQPSMGSEARQCDDDGDCTQYGWYIPSPHFEVRYDGDQVSGWEWQPNANVDITVDGSPIATAQADEWGNFGIGVGEWIDLVPGSNVDVNDGASTKAHTVTSLEIVNVDVDTDMVYGIATPDGQIQVWACGPQECINRWEAVNSAGDWSADFSIPGTDPGEEQTIDIVPGTWVDSGEWDEDGDNTAAGYSVPNPRFVVQLGTNNVDGWEWTRNSEVTIAINGTEAATVPTDEWGNFNYNFGELEPFVPGMEFTITDGLSPKILTTVYLEITNVDPDTDTVSGMAPGGQAFDVWVHGENAPGVQVTADSSGHWTAVFSGQWDIVPDTNGAAQINDSDGDGTWVGWRLSNPTFAVRMTDAQVEGWEWPLGADVTMTIDDPGTPESPDYTDTQTVLVADWDPKQTYVQFNFRYVYFIQPGHVVTLTDGATTKIHVVTNLSLANVDQDTDTVYGAADPGAQVGAWICEWWGCANRHLIAGNDGSWSADFGKPGTQGDEQDLADIVPGTSGEVAEYDDDGDRTQIWWGISNPRMTVSYEHNWVNLDGFTPNGQVTYTIFDYEGGHALFGPVTGPIDSHGNGWISSNLTHVDLIPGMYVVAVDETTGEAVTLTIRTVNLDYISAEDDIAFGTAVPNTTIELNVGETHESGFNLTVSVDEDGNWYVDLAAAGHPIEEYRYANANLYDDEGDSVTAQNPRLHAYVRTDQVNVDNFSKNADVTFTMSDSPGGNILYGPVTLHTDSSGNAGLNLWDLGIDLQIGHYFTAYDHFLGFTKALEIEPFTFETMDADGDIVRGTSSPGEWVDLHVESLFSNWGLDALTDPVGNWYRDYAAEGYDLTQQMWAYGWAIDTQGNWSEDHTTGLPGLEASPAGDWIHGWNFNPNRPVHIEIYDFEGGSLLAVFDTNAGGDTQFHIDTWQDGFDLQAGMYLLVTDTETGKTASLILAFLTFDGINYDAETVWGRASEGALVIVQANRYFEHYEMLAITNSAGEWFANFAILGVDLSIDWSLRATIYEENFNSTVADAPQPPQFTASLDGDWVNGNNWTADNTVTIQVYESEGGPSVAGPFSVGLDNYGNFHFELGSEGLDVSAGQYITVTDDASGTTKALALHNLTIDYLDPGLDVMGGTAPSDTRISVDFDNRQESIQFDLFSSADGSWEANFAAYDFDLRPASSGQVRITDPDGDAVQVNGYVPDPNFSVWPEDPSVHISDWPAGSTVTVTIDYGGTTQSPDFVESFVMESSPWGPGTWYLLSLPERPQSGDFVTVTDSTTTKNHIVTNLHVTMVDPETGLVTGTTDPNVELYMWHNEQGCNYSTSSDGTGQWSFDLNEPDNNGQFCDLSLGSTGYVGQRDEDGDATEIGWRIANPILSVRLDENSVTGYDWPLETDITLTIDDPATPEIPVDYFGTAQMAQAPWGEMIVYFDLNGVYEVKPGDIVSLEGGGYIRSHTVFDGLSVTSVSVDADTVSGTASEGAYIQVNQCNEDGCADRFIEGVTGGTWTVDFSIEGPRDDEKVLRDLQPGMGGEAWQFDENGNSTVRGWYIPNPTIGVRANTNQIEGWEWPLGATITVTVDDPSTPAEPDITRSTVVYEAPWNPEEHRFDLDLQGEIDIQTGFIVTATGDNTTKQHTVLNLAFTNIDIVSDTVQGIGVPDSPVNVWTCDDFGCINREEHADQEGNWSTNFSIPGDQDWEQEIADLQYGSWIDSSVYDEDGDSTMFGLNIPDYSFTFFPAWNGIVSGNWSLDVPIHFTADDPDTTQSPDFQDVIYSQPAPWDPGYLWLIYEKDPADFQFLPGFTLTLDNGQIHRSLVISSIQIAGVDVGNDIVFGTAEPFAEVNVDIEGSDAQRHLDADADGNWSADFSEIGNGGGGSDILYDIQPGADINAHVPDEDGDITMAEWHVYSYTLHAVPAYPEVHGHEWVPGSDITLTIDNDTNPDNGSLFTQTKNADDDPWCGYPCFDLSGVFNLQVGQYVTMTDGEVTKTVQVSVLQITEVNHENDIIRGIADPGSRVMVNIWSQDGLARYVTTEPDGTWVADFSVFGNEDFEQFTTDITYNDHGRAIQLNPDGTDDGTLEYWSVPYWVAPDSIPLVIGIIGNPDLSLPWLNGDTLTILDQLFEPLFRQNGDGTFMSAAATGYTVSPDGLVYTITVRDMIWSDGEPVTAQHYVDGLLRLLDPASGHDYPNLYYPIAGARDYNQGLTDDPNDVAIRALDAHTLEITLELPTAFFPQILVAPSFLPVRLDLIGQYGEARMEPENFVGNGPYLLVERDADHLLLERNSYYYASDQVQFDQVGFAVIPDENERLEAYRRGDVDALWTFARYEYPNIINDPELSQDIDISTQPGIQYLGINVNRYPTDNALVRKALASAIDREYLINTVIGADWHIEATGVIPPSLLGYQGDAVGYPFDELQAQNYLAEAGFPGGAGFPEIKLISNTGHEDIVEYIAQQWRDLLGIPVSVEYFDWGDYLDMLRDCRDDSVGCDYNVYRLGWIVDYTDPNNILADLFGPDSPNQYTGWDNLLYRDLLELSLSEMNETLRLGYIQEAERILVQDDATILPLYFTDRMSLIKPGILPYFGPLIANLNLWDIVPTNNPPTDVVITAPVDPLPINEFVTVQVDFNDPDENDNHTVVIEWDDTTSTNTTVTGLTAVAVHQYQSAGVYTITANVTDSAGASASATFQYVVIFDPEGGFVTGGGWIDSPKGAYTPVPSLTGKATFGFVSKYQKGASIPTGNTEFQFHVANLNFKSTSYNWLVIAGSKAQFKGTGTINELGEYGFMLSAVDGTPDKFRIKIWDKTTDEVIYDNQLGAVDTAIPATEIQGGSIVIHKAK